MLPQKLLKGSESRKGGKVIHTVKYADDTVLLVKEETMLQHMTDGNETLR